MKATFEFKKLSQIMDGDGVEVRRQLILAALLLTTFERFKIFAVERVDSFFSHHTEIKDGEIFYKRGAEFSKLIRERGSPNGRQHANKPFRAALYWFYELNAISKEEFDEVERIYLLRNDVGHELFRIVADDQKPALKLADLLMAFAVYVKIVRWWIKEIEAATDPDITQDDYENLPFDDAESAETIFLRTIIYKALSDDDEFKEILEYTASMRP